MKCLLLFSYALLPKSKYSVKKVEFNNELDKEFSLTGLSLIETYSGSIVYNEGSVDKVLVLGCHTFGEKNPSDSELMARYLEKLGVPNKDIIVNSEGNNTAYQVNEAKNILSDLGNKIEVVGIALACHTQRTGKLLSAYGINGQMISVEEILERDSSSISKEILELLSKFKGSKTESKLMSEANILELMQILDPKGQLQKLITKIRGVRYFDIDIPSTLARPTSEK